MLGLSTIYPYCNLPVSRGSVAELSCNPCLIAAKLWLPACEQVLAELDSLGLTNTTLVTLLGDHGWQVGWLLQWACSHGLVTGCVTDACLVAKDGSKI